MKFSMFDPGWVKRQQTTYLERDKDTPGGGRVEWYSGTHTSQGHLPSPAN